MNARDLVFDTDFSRDRCAARRHFVEKRNVEIREQAHREAARNRRRRHHQQVRLRSQRFHFRAVEDAEAMLLVDDAEAQLADSHPLLNQRVRSEHDRDFARSRARAKSRCAPHPSRCRSAARSLRRAARTGARIRDSAARRAVPSAPSSPPDARIRSPESSPRTQPSSCRCRRRPSASGSSGSAREVGADLLDRARLRAGQLKRHLTSHPLTEVARSIERDSGAARARIRSIDSASSNANSSSKASARWPRDSPFANASKSASGGGS